MFRHVYVILMIFLMIRLFDSKKYKVMLISSTKCEAPTDKMDPSNPVAYDTGVRNLNRHTKVVKTNFTILRPIGPVTMSLRINRVMQSSKEEIFKLEKVDCHNPVTYQLVRVVNLKLNNECMAVPGNYLTENINPQDFSWILTKAMVTPGRYEYVLQFYSEKGLATCNNIVCDIQEKKHV